MVRGFRPSATSSPLDDHRPADRPTAYHTTAATANILCGPCPESQPGQIQANHRRDQSLVMRAHNPFQTESLSLVIGFVWTNQVLIAEMPCYPILDQVNQFTSPSRKRYQPKSNRRHGVVEATEHSARTNGRRTYRRCETHVPLWGFATGFLSKRTAH